MVSVGVEEERIPARKKTVLRTIRIPENLSTELEEAAAADGISFNSLSSAILQEYITWTRKARKFGFAYVSKSLLKIILESANSTELDMLVRERYGGILKDMAMFWYSDASLTSIIRVLELLSLHNWHLDMGKKIDGRKVTLSFHHDLGPKFAVFLRAMLDSTLKEEFHSTPVYEEGDSSLTVHFSLP